MNISDSSKIKGIFFISASLLSFQISLIQIFSIVQWYHFAYMVLSMALLGFGASGTFLIFFKKRLIRYERTALFILSIFTALSMPLCIWITQTGIGTFDSYLVFTDKSEFFKLILTYIILFFPFFLGATVIGYLLTTTRKVGLLYFSNLMGSGAGSLLALAGMYFFPPSRLVPVFSILSLGAAFFFLPLQRKNGIIALACSFLVSLFFFLSPVELFLSQYKSLSYALNMPDSEIILEHSSPQGFIQVVSTKHLRHSPGLSLKHTDPLPHYDVMFSNGNWLGPIYTLPDNPDKYWLKNSVFQLPFEFGTRKNMLCLQSGTGQNVLLGLLNEVEKITAVEGLKRTHRVLNQYSKMHKPHVFLHSKVKNHYLEPRSYVMQATEHFDIITIPTLDAFGGTGGLFAAQEQHLLTLESFEEMWELLSEDGILMVSSWIDYPFRSPFKLLSTVVEMLDKKEVSDFENHIVAIKNWGTMLVLVKKTPFTEPDSSLIIDFCHDKQFDPLILPHKNPEEIPRFHPHDDELFYEYIELLLTPGREKIYDEYDFRIRPARDNQPYFSQFLRLRNLAHLNEIFGARYLPFFELGYLLIWATFIQICIIAVFLILLPLYPLGFKGTKKLWTLLYFSGLGIGFMFIEIAFIQHFILYLGHPIYSASMVIGVMLVSSGIGSYFSGCFNPQKRLLFIIPFTIAAVIFLYSFILPYLIEGTISFPAIIRVLIAGLIISLLSFVMGFAFPTGMSFLNKSDESLTPWAWGINGCFSVISAAGATILAIQSGFQMIFLTAACAYLVCCAAALLLRTE